jgi:uncharacterized membrane protein YfcA
VDPLALVLLALVAGLAGWIDAIAGGGGLLQLPALFVAGVPAPALFGVNKMSSICGTTAAVARYAAHGSVRWPAVLVAAPLAAAASAAGTLALLAAADAASEWIRPAFAVVFVALAIQQAHRALRPPAARDAPARPRPWAVLALVGAIGAYDGCVGPGTGMFLFWAFTTFGAMPPLVATGSAKVVNWTTNAASLATLVARGEVLWAPALAMASMNLVGGLVGARTAIRRGVRFIRLVTAGASVLAAVYLIADAVRRAA